MTDILSVCWGGGVNSTALLVGYLERNLRPDCILFADTGGEKPETYRYLEMFSPWLVARGFPAIEMVKNDGMYASLEDNCLKKNMLPSLAYGFKSCSDKYKKRPQLKFLKARYGSLARVRQAIGIHAGEAHRAKQPKDPPSSLFPLIDWDWGQEECRDAIRRAGIPLPAKSACFYCPASKLPEIRALAKEHPDLLDRALAMEGNADLTSVKGLGRRFSWAEFVERDRAGSQLTLLPIVEPPCGCWDGDDD